MNGEVRLVGGHSRGLLTVFAWLLAILIVPTSAEAQWGAEVRAQLGFGGDELMSVEYTDGSESSLFLGKYLSINVGPVYEAWSSGPASLELQALLGWSWYTTGPQNTDDRLKLSHFPVDLLAFYGYRLPGRDALIRLGGGATYRFGGGMRGTGSLDGVSADFDNALGFTGEASAIVGTFTAGIRYTRMDATFKGLTVPLDASSVGLFVGITTARK